jgi:hypothetical protein
MDRNPRERSIAAMITTGEFGPILSIVLADASKGKMAWTRWESSDGTLAVFHYQVPKDKSDSHVKSCCILEGYNIDGTPRTQTSDVRSAYHADIVFSSADGSIRLLTIEADAAPGALAPVASIAVEYAATDIGGRSYICPVRSVSIQRVHNADQSAISSSNHTASNYTGPLKTFLNDVRFTNYRRFGTEIKVLTNYPKKLMR